MIGIDGKNLYGTPRNEFEGYAACAGEQIEHSGSFEIDKIVQYIEKTFFRQICGGTHGKTDGRTQAAPTQLSAYNSHKIELKSV